MFLPAERKGVSGGRAEHWFLPGASSPLCGAAGNGWKTLTRRRRTCSRCKDLLGRSEPLNPVMSQAEIEEEEQR